MTEKMYSLDEETYYDYDSFTELALSEFESGQEIVVSQGEKREFSHGDFIFCWDFLESAQQCAYDEVGEIAYQSDYLQDVIDNEEKLKELKTIICDWLNKNAEPVPFYGIKNTKEITIKVAEDY